MAASSNPQVKTHSGAVEGKDDGKVKSFLGIPYAQPPVGDLRWKAPQPVAKWNGVKKAAEFGFHCMQGRVFGDMVFHDPGQNEDCLTLNVWVPDKHAEPKLPVMVWIYGGGFTGGSGGLAWYDGENLAAKGPVVVTFNYRLGALGFFAHPDLAKESGRNASGNYGMMDAIAMLQWVKKNISAFGGDPNNVTVAGESAGAIMVGALVGSPQAKGLFHRAIAESGGWMGLTMARMTPSAQAQENGAKAVTALGVKSMAELRAKPLAELTGLSSAGLVVDGYIIPEDLSLTFMNGKQNAVDVLAGSNKDEANFGICGATAGLVGRGGGRGGLTLDAFKTNAQRRFGDAAGDYAKLYGVSSDSETQPAAHIACADEINWNMRQWSAAQAKMGKKAYTYFFTRIPTLNGQPSPQGATHTAEISYAFNNPKGQATQTWDDVDTKLGDAMSSYWVNFITKGDPNGTGLPNWPQFRDMTSKVMVLGDTPQAEATPPAEKLKFFAAAYQRLIRLPGN
jgi:para-nitrobenzyl esterase